MKKVKNNIVLDSFINEQGKNSEYINHTQNLYIQNGLLINYTTIIAVWYNGKCYVNPKRYSSTTSKHQNYLKRTCKDVIILEFDKYKEIEFKAIGK